MGHSALGRELGVVSWNVHWGVAHVPDRPKGELFDPLAELDDALLRATDVMVLPESWRAHDGLSFLDGLRAHGFEHLYETRYRTLDVSHFRRQLTDPGEGWWELAVASRHPVVSSIELPLQRSYQDPVPIRNARSRTTRYLHWPIGQVDELW